MPAPAAETLPEPPRAAQDRVRSREAAVVRWANARFGVITWAALLRLGLTRHEVAHRLEVGWLQRTAVDGVYVLGHRAAVAGQREAVALAASGRGAALAGRSAAAWLGLTEPWLGLVEVVVPGRRTTRLPGVVRWTGALPAGDVVKMRGLRTTAVARTALDLGRVAPELLPEALVGALRRGHDVDALHAGARRGRGVVAVRSAIEELVPGLAHTLSELEVRFGRLLRAGGLPACDFNREVGTDLVDCTWPGHRLVVELDGRRWHEHRFVQDRERDRRRLLEGSVPFRYAWGDVTARRPATTNEVAEALARW